MTIWCCGRACERLVDEATVSQVSQLRKAQRENDHVIACHIVHPGKELKT